MTSLGEFLQRDKEMRKRDEPSGPQSERQGLWRVLSVSMLLAAVLLGIVAFFMV